MQAPQPPRTPRFRPSDEVDFVIVGSGAAGGIIAKELSTAGFSVVVLEQGPRLTEQQFDHDEFGAFFRYSNANDPATQPQTFRASPTAKTEQQVSAIYGRLGGGFRGAGGARGRALRCGLGERGLRLGGA
ncbi:MAG: NAD(P)-binding protein, partial [Vicinamibacterales bacterium]